MDLGSETRSYECQPAECLAGRRLTYPQCIPGSTAAAYGKGKCISDGEFHLRWRSAPAERDRDVCKNGGRALPRCPFQQRHAWLGVFGGAVQGRISGLSGC